MKAGPPPTSNVPSPPSTLTLCVTAHIQDNISQKVYYFINVNKLRIFLNNFLRAWLQDMFAKKFQYLPVFLSLMRTQAVGINMSPTLEITQKSCFNLSNLGTTQKKIILKWFNILRKAIHRNITYKIRSKNTFLGLNTEYKFFMVYRIASYMRSKLISAYL